MEGKNDIFLASNNAVGYLAGPMYTKYSMTFGSIHLVRADLMTVFSILPTFPFGRTCTH